MSSLIITPRRTRSGPRFVVRYRLGGRAYPIVHGGSFRTLKEAKARRDLIAKEIANGRDPAEALRFQAPERLSLAQWRERFLASLLDVDERTTRSYRFALQRADAYFGDTTDPLALRVEDITVSRRATKGNRARWVYLPEWLTDAITATCAVEDRTPERRVFQGLTEASARTAMTRACKLAQVPHYHPHDLRHRRISIWHNSGIPARELAHRAGHSKASMSLDVYSHVMPVDEVPSERFLELIADGRS